MKTDYQDKIDEYILGRMSEKDKSIFEEEVKKDESLKKQLEFTLNVKKAISSRQEKLKKLELMRNAYNNHTKSLRSTGKVSSLPSASHLPPASHQPSTPAPKQKSKHIWLWASGAAAAITIGLFISQFNRYNASDISPEIIRGGNDVFEYKSPIISDSLVNDSIHKDTVKVTKEKGATKKTKETEK